MDTFIISKLRHHLEELKKYRYSECIEIETFRMCRQDDNAFADPKYDDKNWETLQLGESWGGYDQVMWLRTTVKIPDSFLGKKIELLLDLGPRECEETSAESLLYIEGEAYHGLDNWHFGAALTEKWSRVKEFQIALRCWSGMVSSKRKIHRSQICTLHVPTDKLYSLGKILLETAEVLDEQDIRRIKMLKLLDTAWNNLDFRMPGKETYQKSVEKVLTQLRQEVERIRLDGEDKPVVAVCGHSHIDMAWMWKLEHTKEKAARSFSTVLTLMEEYPEYLFSQSSPYLYQQIKEYYPDIYEKIKARIMEKRWEITGGMWVEPDTNIPGGESLVRQILLGKGYIKEQFNVDAKVLWLPDVFGYSWVLPQLLKKSGFELFWTNKMCWNQYNRFPYDTFLWIGMDGSQILTQLGTCPEKGVTWGGTYNGVIAPWEVKETWARYQQKEINQEVLMPFGWGDGGGGPTKEMLDAYEYIRDVPGLPKVEMKFIEQYAQDIIENLQEEKIPIWDGEMYFEYHRGTYTSQANIKKKNRFNEVLYHDAEQICAWGEIYRKDTTYPAKDLKKGWEMICLNQFHDIIPGSGIRQVYEDAEASYLEIEKIGQQALEQAMTRTLSNINGETEGMVVFQTLPWERNAIAELDGEYCGKTIEINNRPAISQTIERNGIKKQLIYITNIPAMGYRLYKFCDAEDAGTLYSADTQKVESPFYTVCFNECGQMVSIYDKEEKREVLKKEGRGNILQVFEDRPHQFDAWNTEIYAYDKMWEVTDLQKTTLIENGAIQTTLEFVYHFGLSTICQLVTVSNIRKEITFQTTCDWVENDVLLKAAFELDIRATKATYDIQFGNIERNNHNNTMWDYAQFEVCGHKWADISEGNYGVSLLNDCKYGMDCKESVMRLTLIKTPTYPDAVADRGQHTFSYALLPHKGNWKEAETARTAYEFNYPLRVALYSPNSNGNLPSHTSFCKVKKGNIIVETLKKAEDGDGWILRSYEYKQNREEVIIECSPTPNRAAECDLLENVESELEVIGGEIKMHFTPYEIKTIRVWYDK